MGTCFGRRKTTGCVEGSRFNNWLGPGRILRALRGPVCLLVYPKRTTLRQRLHTDNALFVDFVAYLLRLDPLTRPTAAEALRHPWLAEGDDPLDG